MKTRAGVLWGVGEDWEIVDLELDEPRAGEVLVRYVAAGLCHSDEHLRHGDIAFRAPMIGGHEGAGVIEAVGPGVVKFKPGDHIVTSFMPHCGSCPFCLTGRSNLCDRGSELMEGHMLDGTFRFHGRDQDIGAMSLLGTFSQYGVIPQESCVKVASDLPLDVVGLVACGVPTGWGSAVYAAEAKPGDTIVVVGVGGVGINAVQGAAHAGALNVLAVDPIEHKRTLALELGATSAFATIEEAHETAMDLTNGVGADSAILTVDVINSDIVSAGFDVVRKGGTLVVTALANPDKATIQISGSMLTLLNKRIQGSMFGSGNPHYDIQKMISLYRNGELKLDELVTTRYKLDDLNQGYADLDAGLNIRGVVIHEH